MKKKDFNRLLTLPSRPFKLKFNAEIINYTHEFWERANFAKLSPFNLISVVNWEFFEKLKIITFVFFSLRTIFFLLVQAWILSKYFWVLRYSLLIIWLCTWNRIFSSWYQLFADPQTYQARLFSRYQAWV